MIPLENQDPPKMGEIYMYSCADYGGKDVGCTVYDKRPSVCENFPYGSPAFGFDNCVWNVEIQLDGA